MPGVRRLSRCGRRWTGGREGLPRCPHPLGKKTIFFFCPRPRPLGRSCARVRTRAAFCWSAAGLRFFNFTRGARRASGHVKERESRHARGCVFVKGAQTARAPPAVLSFILFTRGGPRFRSPSLSIPHARPPPHSHPAPMTGADACLEEDFLDMVRARGTRATREREREKAGRRSQFAHRRAVSLSHLPNPASSSPSSSPPTACPP